jgi:hypothetical protein
LDAPLIDSDLEFISQLTQNKCLFNSGDDIMLEYKSPKDLFQNRVDEKDLYRDLSVEGFVKMFEKSSSISGFGEVFKSLLKSIPLEESLKEVFEDTEKSQQLDAIFPGLKENPTMEGFFKSFSNMLVGLNEDEKYKDLRKIVQSGLGINRDRMFDNQNPFQIIDKEHKKMGVSIFEHFDNSKNAPKWFNEITNEYILLDMHGYQEDNININRGRKETFKNTTEDAFHAAFASTCNFYVLNDNKSYKKTKLVFEKLNTNTLVFKPNEFIEYYNTYVKLKDQLLHLTIPLKHFVNGDFIENKIEGATIRTYFTQYFFFDFFDKFVMLIPDNGGRPTMMMSKSETNNHRIYILEIQSLVSTILKLLGNDINNIGDVDENELMQNDWIGRKWEIEGFTLSLVKFRGYFQLYIDTDFL